MAEPQREIRHGRNWIRRGDLVRVRSSRPGKHDGFLARFEYAEPCQSGMTYAVMQLEGDRPQRWRFVHDDRVVRKARTRDPRNR